MSIKVKIISEGSDINTQVILENTGQIIPAYKVTYTIEAGKGPGTTIIEIRGALFEANTEVRFIMHKINNDNQLQGIPKIL